MASSSRAEIQKAILEAINESAELRATIEAAPDQLAGMVRANMPVDTGEAKLSVEVKARRTPYKRLTTRRITVGTVFSDDDPAKINTLEYGRSASDDNGETPEFAPFRRAAAEWNDKAFEPTKGRKSAPKSNADWDAALGFAD